MAFEAEPDTHHFTTSHKRRIALVTTSYVEDAHFPRDASLNTAKAAAHIARSIIGRCDREVFLTMHVDSKKRVLSAEVTAVGGVCEAYVQPGEVFKAALLSNAVGVIVAHNHPSGNVTPSDDDMRIAQSLRSAGELLGVPIVDYLIVGPTKDYYSFLVHGE